MAIAFGGKTAVRTVARDGWPFILAFHWVNNEPAMCTIPAVRFRRDKRQGAFVIPLDSLHLYRDEGYCLMAAAKALGVMGLPFEKDYVHKLVDAWRAEIDFLKDMRPVPVELEETGPQLLRAEVNHGQIVLDVADPALNRVH